MKTFETMRKGLIITTARAYCNESHIYHYRYSKSLKINLQSFRN